MSGDVAILEIDGDVVGLLVREQLGFRFHSGLPNYDRHSGRVFASASAARQSLQALSAPAVTKPKRLARAF
jgi:hypothetical protein